MRFFRDRHIHLILLVPLFISVSVLPAAAETTTTAPNRIDVLKWLRSYAATKDFPESFNEANAYLKTLQMLDGAPEQSFVRSVKSDLNKKDSDTLSINGNPASTLAEIAAALELSEQIKALPDERKQTLVDWIGALQESRGGFREPSQESSTIKATADAITALMILKHGELIGDRTYSWIINHKTRSGGFASGDNQANIEETALALQVLDKIDKIDSINESNVVKFVMSCQKADYGFGDYPENPISTVRSTHLALYCLSALNAADRIDKTKMSDFLMDRYRLGGFAPILQATRPELLSTYDALSAMNLIGDNRLMDKQTAAKETVQTNNKENSSDEVVREETEQGSNSLPGLLFAVIAVLAGTGAIIKTTLQRSSPGPE